MCRVSILCSVCFDFACWRVSPFRSRDNDCGFRNHQTGTQGKALREQKLCDKIFDLMDITAVPNFVAQNFLAKRGGGGRCSPCVFVFRLLCFMVSFVSFGIELSLC